MSDGNRFFRFHSADGPIRASSSAHLKMTLRKRGDIPGIVKAKDVFTFGEDFSDDKGTVRTFMRITNPSKPYVRAYD